MSKSSIQKWFDPRIIIGFAVSAAISVILYVTGSGSIPSMTVGLLGSILTVLIAIRLDLQRTEAQLLDAMGLSQDLYNDDWLRNTLRQIVRNYLAIKQNEKVRPIYIEQLQLALRVCSETIAELAEGRITVKDEDERVRLVIRAVREAKNSIKAVSHINIKWWFSELGGKFLVENRMAKAGCPGRAHLYHHSRTRC